MNVPVASASLYVGDLNPDVTEPMLFEIFSNVGPVASIRVCRDAVSRRSLGYAYVNFHNSTDAERALDTLNYYEINERPCRIMWKHRDPSMRKNGVGNIFIKNLDKSLVTRHLNDTFSEFGNIISCKVAMDEKGESKGHGYIQYETKEQAENAVARVNGMLIKDKKVFVGPFISRAERDSMLNSDQTYTNIYVKNVHEDVTDAEFQKMFEEFGAIDSAVIMRDKESGKSRGFGFVNYKEHDAASKAIEEMSGKSINEKQLWCGRAEKKAKRQAELRKKFEQRRAEQQAKYQGVNLFVKNLDDVVDDEKLRSYFTNYGTITSAKVMTDDKGHSKGFGFVCFSSPDEAQRALTATNNQMFHSKPIYVALHQTKEFRKAQLQAQFAQRQNYAMQRPMAPNQMMPSQMPVFFPPGGPAQPGRQPMFMYPAQMQRGGGWMGQPRVVQSGVPQGRQQRPFRNNPRQGQQPQGQPAAMQQGAVPAAMQQGGRGGNQRVKYAPGVRNQGRDQAGAPAGAPAPAPAPASTEINAATLASMTPAMQKQTLGERLYAQIVTAQPELAGKITGMLLELDNTELLHLIESPEALQGKVGEALAALEAHSQAEAAEKTAAAATE